MLVKVNSTTANKHDIQSLRNIVEGEVLKVQKVGRAEFMNKGMDCFLVNDSSGKPIVLYSNEVTILDNEDLLRQYPLTQKEAV